MQQLDATSSTLNSFPIDLQRINDVIQPRIRLDENLLRSIKSLRDTIILQMIMTTLAVQVDLSLMRKIIVTENPEPVDIKAKSFVQKMFKVISDGIEEEKIGINALRSFLNQTLPTRLHMDEIKARLNRTSPDQVPQIAGEYAGPNNPEKQSFIKAQAQMPVLKFMETLDSETVNNIVG